MGKPGFSLVYTLIQGAVWSPYFSRAMRVAPLREMEQEARFRKDPSLLHVISKSALVN